jgi:hypothetical protein
MMGGGLCSDLRIFVFRYIKYLSKGVTDKILCRFSYFANGPPAAKGVGNHIGSCPSTRFCDSWKCP